MTTGTFLGLPPFHCHNPGRGFGGKAPSRRGSAVSPRENFWNCIRDLVHFDAVWWQLFVGRRTRYICNFAITRSSAIVEGPRDASCQLKFASCHATVEKLLEQQVLNKLKL